MRLDLGDVQEALRAHDAWMEDVSQSLQEAHERSHQLAEDVAEMAASMQAKLDAKTDITAWSDMNDDIDLSVRTVRDMASALRLEVDSRRRKVDETLGQIRGELRLIDDKFDAKTENQQRIMDEAHAVISRRIDERAEHSRTLEAVTHQHEGVHRELRGKVDENHSNLEARLGRAEAELRRQDEDMHKEVNDRIDGVERHHANVSKETSKRLGALDLRLSGLQGASGEARRDINKLQDEVNGLTVKSAAHDVDLGACGDGLRQLERRRAEDEERRKQSVEAIHEELDQKVYERSFQGLESSVAQLTRGTVKLCQVVGVFPGARLGDGTGEELDIDVELLNWEDCARNMAGRVAKVWNQVSSQRYRSLLDMLGHKADHSVLR
eukprot:CAMPEP_0115323888 /NCGR_PEP_ID=MMETSP0270-20121206/82180_1 /TAXON_ID=71861 /ORGANISM="Scrippsiella trochoidea, Strain CCMP3099" /LENGTH=380 /DNA_ID=CAMNT_0002743959 /DNA_START=15 /DNA_END=1154 /DNA_ORIENTATION=-